MCVLNSGDVLLAIRQRADPRLAIRSNETLKTRIECRSPRGDPEMDREGSKGRRSLASGYVPVLSLVRQPSLFFCRALNN